MNWILHRIVYGKFFIYYLLISLFSTSVICTKYKKCYEDKPEMNAKKYPYYKNQPVTIKIDTSNRITHQLNSHVFRIFLQEILGYPRVELSYYEDNFNITKSIERLSGYHDIPTATINLEVWITPDYDTILAESSLSVEDCGNVAKIGGRFGWFIPYNLTHPIEMFHKKWYTDISEVSWTFFKNPYWSSFFDIDGSDEHYVRRNALRNKETNEYVCNNRNCTEGVYVPEQCRRESCALLLAPDYYSTNFVIEHINELNLYVKVVWLGNNLPDVVNTLKQKYMTSKSTKSLVILFWSPSLLIADESEFLTVAFKKCELQQSLGCKYEMNRLVKFSWNSIQELGKPLLDVSKQYTFEDNEYAKLLEIYKKNPERGVEAASCEWMKRSEERLRFWKPSLDDSKTIYIGGIFPMRNSPFVGPGIAIAAKMAESAINAAGILSDYKLEVFISDGQCTSDLVMKMFIDYVVNKQFESMIGVLGPACSDTVEPLARVSKHYQTMIISYSAEGSSFSDREKYPYFFRTIGENRHYIPVYVKFLKYMGWKQVAALTEDGQKYTEYISLMQTLLDDNQITFISNIKFPRDQEDILMTKYLEGLKKKRARIIIADVVSDVLRLIMCEAYKLKMTAKEGYIWFLPISYSTLKGGNINCTAQEMEEAEKGYFSMAHAYYGEDDQIMQENKTVKQWREEYRNSTKYMSNYAGYAYDAVWTYALATAKLAKTDPEALSNIHSNATIKKLVEYLNETDFMGVSGRIKFRGGPSRFSVINIMQWYDKQTHIVGQFHPNLSDNKPEILGGRLDINDTLIKWFTKDGSKPSDGKLPPEVCALDGFARFFNVDCSMAIVILNIIVITTVVLIVGLIIYKIKERYDKKVQATEEYIKALNVEWSTVVGMKELSKWEVSRDVVIINRKLGEGAFGTVYGGEALFTEGWLPVAVKSLKMESSHEDKIDFLSEADVMRNFSHTNIVKLLGVITIAEPLQTIMEFMLYGDLKTYLLARRHLAFSTSDEVSSERLTSMSLDIARGLSYLAENKFVHRDLASRNCLVNANRNIKIGDFGMCRPMSTNEYYRFNRRGMLPVRWMAPESLELGIFTTASDVWSYGVILYEMVTFGSFPFQGLSNTEVLDVVKEGKCLNVPIGVKPQLEALMNSCWNRSYKARPQAKEIVAYIAGYKDLLTACLDAPLSSVQIENSDELEIRFPDRKCSSPTSKNPPIPNGTMLEPDVLRFRRQTSAPETSVNIPLDSYCAKEPLLGSKETSSSNNYGKYARNQNINKEVPVPEEDDYIPASVLMNGNAMTRI
ncbi:hypothetical protein WA026_008145 [Henosepilachna vigintioctopunctata]|uniref:Protein kinase domain-containing protein n=1 Tax=Henosepilachna vigintioctopunctata TaxID=420089 RepID=A0AAW1TIM0_9CUCU